MRAAIGMLRATPVGASSWDSGVAGDGTTTVDSLATTTGMKAALRLAGRATGHPRKVDMDSGVAKIAVVKIAVV